MDLSVLGVLLVSGVFAFIRGFVREIFSLGSWIGASLVSVFMYPVARPWVHEHIKSELAADAATAVGLFCVTLIILIPIGSLLSSLVRGEALTAIDRSLGFLFGLVRGFLVMCLLYLCVNWMWSDVDQQPEWMAQAKTRPILAYGADVFKGLIPEEQRDKMAREVEKSRAIADEAAEKAKALETLSVPLPGNGQPAPAASPSSSSNGKQNGGTYGEDARDRMNNLIEQKAKP